MGVGGRGYHEGKGKKSRTLKGGNMNSTGEEMTRVQRGGLDLRRVVTPHLEH